MATKTTIQAVKGTRDFYPEAMAFRNWLYGQVRSISDTPGAHATMKHIARIETLPLRNAKTLCCLVFIDPPFYFDNIYN